MCSFNKKIKAIQVMTLIFLLRLYMLLSQKFNLRQPLSRNSHITVLRPPNTYGGFLFVSK